MQSRLVNEDMRPAGDEALMLALANVAVTVRPDGVHMVFGVEGPDRRVYRLIEIQSLLEAVSVIAAIRQAGLSGSPGRREHGVLLQRVFVPRQAAADAPPAAPTP